MHYVPWTNIKYVIFGTATRGPEYRHYEKKINNVSAKIVWSIDRQDLDWKWCIVILEKFFTEVVQLTAGISLLDFRRQTTVNQKTDYHRVEQIDAIYASFFGIKKQTDQTTAITCTTSANEPSLHMAVTQTTWKIAQDLEKQSRLRQLWWRHHLKWVIRFDRSWRWSHNYDKNAALTLIGITLLVKYSTRVFIS